MSTIDNLYKANRLTGNNRSNQFTTVTTGLLMWLLLTMLGGCANENVDDLQKYITEVKAQKKGKIPELPEVKIYSSYTYDDTDLRNPFKPTVTQRVAHSKNSVKPDDNRKREVLEQFPLDTLKMVGSLEQNGERWALIQASDGTLYRTTSGRYIGQDNGRIMNITETEVVLQEIVSDGLGGWIRRQATLSVSQ